MVRNMDGQKCGWLEICIVRKMNGQIYMDGRNMDGKKYGQVEIWMPRNIDG